MPAAGAQESGRAQAGRETPVDVSAWIHIDERGRVTAYTGKVEIGQNIRTSLSQVVADELRVPIESIAFVMADTDLTPFDQGTFGSRTTPAMAPQLARAAATAREILIDQAAARWQMDRASLRAAEAESHRRRRPIDRVRRSHRRKAARRTCDRRGGGARAVGASRQARSQGAGTRFRHGRACLHAGPRSPQPRVRLCRKAAGLRSAPAQR